MTPERLAEIRQACDIMPWGALPMVRELLDYIDGLKFANGVLDSAAKDAQAWSYEAQTAKEAYCELLEANRVTKEAGGVIAQLNGMIDELRAQLEAQRGGAVVVPEPTVKQWIKEVLDAAYNDPEPHATMRAATKWFRENAKAISADRVLGEGMVGVDRKGLQDVYEALAYSQPSEPSVDPHSNSMAHRRALGFCADALRSAKGEVEG